eukprot:gnl/Spiro4/15926_TR8560_c0_g1_i1.p1 gnl/Spiro4/15926_TR8560_c0_g1~~gnl/Spiro4/15926_TR8560_c0_g1_i1.p1  ORF type:complete len:388 (+),score=114.41 gnl/Spiro4/15926_TR8560_c0_g1_i1:76-1164(+)
MAAIDGGFHGISSTGPGGFCVIIKEGRVIHKRAYGLAVLHPPRPATVETPFHLASCGKQFTTTMIMMLKDRGMLRVDDPVAQHIPELHANRAFEHVTIRHLMTHTSGFEDAYNDFIDVVEDDPTNEQVLVWLAQHWRPAHPPNTKYSYCNTAYDLMGTLICRLLGCSFNDALQQLICRPLGMTRTFSGGAGSEADAAMFSSVGAARSYTKGKLEEGSSYEQLNGSGSVYTTADDLVLYDAALWSGGLCSSESLAEMFTPHLLADGKSTEYGFGWNLCEGGNVAGNCIWHNGSWLGFVSNICRWPKFGVTVFQVSNKAEFDVDASIERIEEALLASGELAGEPEEEEEKEDEEEDEGEDEDDG